MWYASTPSQWLFVGGWANSHGQGMSHEQTSNQSPARCQSGMSGISPPREGTAAARLRRPPGGVNARARNPAQARRPPRTVPAVSLYESRCCSSTSLAAAARIAGIVAYTVVVLGDGGGAARRALAVPALAI